MADRSDLDLFVAPRLVLPVWRMVRVYGEVGLGTRLSSAFVQRSDGLGTLTEREQRVLLVTALGVQARVSSLFTVGLRGELVPVGSGPDLATFAADLTPTRNRLAGMVTVGVHF